MVYRILHKTNSDSLDGATNRVLKNSSFKGYLAELELSLTKTFGLIVSMLIPRKFGVL